jgi:hypothetical protein
MGDGWPDRYQAASNHLSLIDEDWAQPIKPAGDFGLCKRYRFFKSFDTASSRKEMENIGLPCSPLSNESGLAVVACPSLPDYRKKK